jgi:type IV pilus assembly protein PilQ
MYPSTNLSTGKRTRKQLLVWFFVAGAMVAVAVNGGRQSIAASATANAAEIAADAEKAAEPAQGSSTEPQDKGADKPAQGQPRAEAKTEAPAAKVESQAVAGSVSDDGRITSLTFKTDWGIRDALQFLGASYRRNIVPSSKVDGALTVTSLYNVTFDEALSAILGCGFRYQQDGSFIRVYTEDEYKKLKENPERMIYKVFTLYYISAAEAKKLVTPVLSANTKVEVTTAAITDFPTGESISKVTGGGDNTAMNDTIIIHDYPENIVEAEKVLKAVDARPKQVLIEATILSVTLTEDMQFGIDWQQIQTAVTGISGVSRSTEFFKFAGTSQVTKTGGMTVAVAHDDVGAFIRAVEEVSHVTVLANPKILAVNKQLGQVYIGKKLGYKSQTTQTEISTTEQVNFLDTGTKLSFRPYIADDGYIRMDIHPKDSSGALNAQNVPDETSAELVTNIIVRDGQTIVIGGLFRDKVTTKKTQIPVLGDLPVVGGAFRGTADGVERQEVMVLLTPHIIEEPSETGGQARAEDVDRKRFGATEELQPIGRIALAEDYYAKAVKFHVAGDKKSALKNLSIALRIQPAHLEALRLKEKILTGAKPAERKKLERVMLSDIEHEDAGNWTKR